MLAAGGRPDSAHSSLHHEILELFDLFTVDAPFATSYEANAYHVEYNRSPAT